MHRHTHIHRVYLSNLPISDYHCRKTTTPVRGEERRGEERREASTCNSLVARRMANLYSISVHALSNTSRVTSAITSQMQAHNTGRSGTQVAHTPSITYPHKIKSSSLTSSKCGGQN
jgi:hypothetical protein